MINYCLHKRRFTKDSNTPEGLYPHSLVYSSYRKKSEFSMHQWCGIISIFFGIEVVGVGDSVAVNNRELLKCKVCAKIISLLSEWPMEQG